MNLFFKNMQHEQTASQGPVPVSSAVGVCVCVCECHISPHKSAGDLLHSVSAS